MHQRNSNVNMTATFVPPPRSNSVQQNDTIHARLVAFCSTSAGSLSTNEIEHRYVPRPFIESDFLFESCLVVFKIITLFLQYILIYKSEKWIGPFSTPTDSFIHWNHIDRYVVIILIIFCLSLQEKLFLLQAIINVVVLIYSFWYYSWKYVLLFTYPLFCALLINQDNNPKSNYHHHQYQVSISSDNLPGHWCSDNACHLRSETDCLHIEFQLRIRHILFSSFLATYYICIVPVAFCNTYYIRLDLILLLQYGVILFISLIMIYTSHYLPLELLTVFHRNGKHLGSWHCLMTNNNTVMIQPWDEKNQIAYQPNSIVKHKQHIYRSSNSCASVAEPGNVYHTRFSVLFSRPYFFPLVLCSLQIILLIIQIFFVFIDQRWFVLLTQMMLFIFNTYTIYHTIRDIYLLYLVYR
ncbi:unnamed protein product [Rotaria magnacalcarata]|uniref:Transmembrane protein 39A n=4 Tax=Rotaria magnacalcarata TaxID=392030 RepID=A0A816LZP1_9BILA|nr:unnamed protein product [Rotaria magnacalcarata]CAF1678668.1 unnamed protein product [Rotaria magnacalcarata]CAF1939188.1 unnamed protein product [Rotaria magnacalcarata]CAF2024719.1 unnamed protein product [Rotaria magnacalcarata]CAF2042122.1 unnamed protein product [Rotaria magnacalcarata]